jgi:hypothetical protein
MPVSLLGLGADAGMWECGQMFGRTPSGERDLREAEGVNPPYELRQVSHTRLSLIPRVQPPPLTPWLIVSQVLVPLILLHFSSSHERVQLCCKQQEAYWCCDRAEIIDVTVRNVVTLRLQVCAR